MYLATVVAATANNPQLHFMIRLKLCQPRTCNKCVKLLADEEASESRAVSSSAQFIMRLSENLKEGIWFRDEKWLSKCALLCQNWMAVAVIICLTTVDYFEDSSNLQILFFFQKIINFVHHSLIFFIFCIRFAYHMRHMICGIWYVWSA